MNKKIKYGVVGAGHLGRFHIQQILNCKDVQLVGLYDSLNSTATRVGKEFKISVYNSLTKLLQCVDAVSICTPASHHYSVACLALENNCHVFVEKPIASNYKDACSLVDLNKKYKKKFQVGHIERFNSAFTKFLTFKPSPVFVESHRLTPFGDRGLDVAVVLDLMIHDIDLILSFVQSPIVNISSSGASVLSSFIDLANARIEFENGCVANITASRISNKQMRKMRIFEKNSYSVLDFQNQSLDRWHIKNQKTFNQSFVNEKPINALYEELKSFIRCIKNNTPVVVSAQNAAKALKVALKIQKTIEKNI